MSLFDDMMKNEQYASLFNNLPSEEKAILMNSMKQMVDDIESKFINPLKSLHEVANKNNPENEK